MNKLNRILIVVLVLQLALATVILWPRSAPTEGGPSLFPDLETNRVASVTITGADGAQIEMVKKGIDWVLPEADDYPVQGENVDSLLVKIAGLRTGQAVTETGSSHERLGVAENAFERRVEFILDDGTYYTLYVGTSPSYGATHVRVGGQDEVYLTSDLTMYDVGVLPTDWADRVYFSVPSDRVVSLTLENANGVFKFIRFLSGGELMPAMEVWSLTDITPEETLDTEAVDALLNRVASVSMIRPLGTEEKPEYGMDEPAAVVTLRTQNDEGGSELYTLRVGAQDVENGGYVFISSESPYFVRVSEYTAQSLVENTRQDFLEVPPTPEATPEE